MKKLKILSMTMNITLKIFEALFVTGTIAVLVKEAYNLDQTWIRVLACISLGTAAVLFLSRRVLAKLIEKEEEKILHKMFIKDIDNK